MITFQFATSLNLPLRAPEMSVTSMLLLPPGVEKYMSARPFRFGSSHRNISCTERLGTYSDTSLGLAAFFPEMSKKRILSRFVIDVGEHRCRYGVQLPARFMTMRRSCSGHT